MTSKRAVLTVLLSSLVAAAASAQDPTGSIEDVVSDPSQRSVPGARVTARHLETGFAQQATAAPDGFYRVVLLPVGEYVVVVEAPPFPTVVREGVQVSVSQRSASRCGSPCRR